MAYHIVVCAQHVCSGALYCQVNRGLVSMLSVIADVDVKSSWFQCLATNKLGSASQHTEFYVSGTVHA